MERLGGFLFFRKGNEMRRKEGVGVYIEGLGKVKGSVN